MALPKFIVFDQESRNVLGYGSTPENAIKDWDMNGTPISEFHGLFKHIGVYGITHTLEDEGLPRCIPIKKESKKK